MKKVNKDQLVSKLVEIFKDADVDIDEIINEFKSQLEARKRKRYEDLEKLFDKQIQTLKDRGCPEQIIELLTEQKRPVVFKASEMAFEKGHIPFLPVIPRPYRGLYDLVAMVWNKDKQGCNHLNPVVIIDTIDTPTRPYYIYDVEDGEATLKKSSETAEKVFKKQSRFPLTVDEVIALCIHTDVLSRHTVLAVASRYNNLDQVLIAYLDYYGQPLFNYTLVSNSHDHWGSPSCGSR